MTKLSLNEFLPFRLNRLSAEFSTRMHRIYGKPYGIDIAQWRTMVTIGSLGEATAHQIVLSTRTNKSTISRAVHKLKQRGWITGEEMAGDRRNVTLKLTKEGKAAYDDIAAQVLTIEQDVLAASGLDLAQLEVVIAQLETGLDIEKDTDNIPDNGEMPQAGQ